MKFELICADIDGTLLDDQKRLLPPVRDSLRRAAAKGILIVLASGRMPAGIATIEKQLGIACIKACSAGTYILQNDRCISAEYMPLDAIKKIDAEITRKYHLPLWIFWHADWYVTRMDDYVRQEEKIVRYHPDIADAEELTDRWSKEGKNPNKLLIAAEPAKIQHVYKTIKDWSHPDIDMACSSPEYLEIFPKGVDKGTALVTICRKLNIDIHHTIAFGDQELDIPMIEAAGVGVAMGNSIQRLKDRADIVTKTNNEAGVAEVLDRFLTDQRGV